MKETHRSVGHSEQLLVLVDFLLMIFVFNDISLMRVMYATATINEDSLFLSPFTRDRAVNRQPWHNCLPLKYQHSKTFMFILADIAEHDASHS
jgi:hypothetical protein